MANVDEHIVYKGNSTLIFIEVSKLWLGFYMLTGGIFCMFFLFITFEDVYFFYLLTAKITASCVTWLQKRCFLSTFFFRITLLFKILLLPIISLGFPFLLYAIIGLSSNAVLSLGLICNKC